MKNISMFSILLLLLFTEAGFSQVAINTTGLSADPSAMLDVSSIDKGFLIPRVTLISLTDDVMPVNNPATGLMVYNSGGTITPGIYFWAGHDWVSLASMDQVHSILPDSSEIISLGEMFEYNAIGAYSTLNVPSAGTWIPWITASEGDCSGMNYSSSSLIIENAGIYNVAFNASAIMPGGKIIESALFVNGIRQDDMHCRTWVKDGGKSHNISFSGLISLIADDVITVGFTLDDNAVIRLELANLSLNKIN